MNDEAFETEFEISGTWSLRDSESVPGTLRHHPGGELRLRTIGGFDSLDSRVEGKKPVGSFDLVGTDTRYRTVLLLDCMLVSSSRSFHRGTGGISSQEIIARDLVVGVPEGLSKKELHLDALNVWFTQTDPWVWEPTFQRKAEGTKTVAEHTPPPTREWNVPAIDASIGLWGGLWEEGGSFFEFRSRLSFAFKIEPRESRPYRWFYDQVWPLRDLVSLLVGEPSYLSRVTGLLSNPENDFIDLAIVFPQPHYRKRPEVLFGHQLAPLRSIEPQMESVLQSWFSGVDDRMAIRTLFFDRLLDLEIYDMPSLFALMQVLEGWHRLRGTTQNASDPNSFNMLKTLLFDAIPGTVPTQLKDRVKGAIGFANDASFRTRLQEILGGLDSEFRRHFFADQESFISTTVNLRNYLAHLLPSATNPLADSRTSILTTERLRLLAICALLREAGLSETDCEEGLLERFGWVARA